MNEFICNDIGLYKGGFFFVLLIFVFLCFRGRLLICCLVFKFGDYLLFIN